MSKDDTCSAPELLIPVREMTVTELTQAYHLMANKVHKMDEDITEMKADTKEIIEWTRDIRGGMKVILAFSSGIGKFLVWMAAMVGAVTVVWGTFKQLFPHSRITDTFKINLQ